MSNVALTKVPHLMTLADLSVPQINRILAHSHHLKQQSTPWLLPHGTISRNKASKLRLPPQSLFNKTIALIFSKRSTRTRIAAETSAELLGGRALFLGKEDIQLGVNESYRDTARVIGGMTQGIFARVGDHSEIEVSFFSVFFFSTYHSKYPHLNTGTSKILPRPSPQRPLLTLAPLPSPRRSNDPPREQGLFPATCRKRERTFFHRNTRTRPPIDHNVRWGLGERAA